MANHFRGEKEIELNGISYTMIVDMGVLSEFESETGSDFMNVAIKAIRAYVETRKIDDMFTCAEKLTSAISLNHAAWLFYLAAKKGNSQVEFGEIQEALLLDYDLTDENKLYPILFVSLVEFAIIGSNVKKKT